jgi:hypothetical protein
LRGDLILINIIKKSKMIGVYYARLRVWEAFTVFWWYVWCLFKNSIPPYHWNHHNIFFLLGWCMSGVMGWFVKIHARHLKFYKCPLIYWDFNFNPYSFDFLFFFLTLFKKFDFFSISSFNRNLWYVIISYLVPNLFIF